MVDALKKIDKKILIILGIVILLPIFIIVFLAIIQGCGNSKITAEKYENKMVVAAEQYFTDKGLPTNESELKTVELSTLVKEGYIKSTEDLIGDSSCKGTVTVRKNGLLYDENKEGYLNYIVDLVCNNYQTNTLKKNILEDLVTQGNGLYEMNGYYVYKGNDVNNYVSFFDKDYVILNVDKNGIAKLLKIEKEELDVVWDNKYNIDNDSLSGINKYNESSIKRALNTVYNSEKVIKTSAKKHLVANDVCVDSTKYLNGELKKYSCTNKIENQVISLIDIDDYALASLDENCTGLYSRSCINYNYLKGLRISTWTMNSLSDNSYEVYYLSNGNLKKQVASDYNYYNIVIYLDINEKIVSGNGSLNKPYVIK
jgi:hypothetical protein